jgi:hypothetical protein
MPASQTPLNGQDGISKDGATVLVSPPLSYIPCKGEVGLSLDKKFLPLEPLYALPRNEGIPGLRMVLPINRNAPWFDQSGMTVAIPCIEPYDREVNDPDARTVILDTVPDAITTPEERALPGYVPNPGISKIISRTHFDFDLTKFNDTEGVAYLWTFLKGGTPAVPHPAVRTGQTRYSGISGAAVGTAYTGTPFLPATGADLGNGRLSICAYRYGFLLGWVNNFGSPYWSIQVKLGRGSATWNKVAQTLTLAETQTPGCTIKYQINGGALTTYTAPISITDTKTITWHAEKTGSLTSDTWTTIITYADATPPDDFTTIYFSALPAINMMTANALLTFQRQADWYVSPSGSGNGLTPSTPASAASIFGSSTSLAQSARSISISNSSGSIVLSRSGANPSGSLIKISTDGGATFSTYTAPVAPSAPGKVHFKIVRADGSDFTRLFVQPWFLGTGSQVRTIWNKTAATLTLSYETPQDATAGVFVVGCRYRILTIGTTDFTAIGAASNTVGEWFNATGAGSGTGTASRLDAEDVRLLYSLDGSAPSLPYTGPITISIACTPKVTALHDAVPADPHDFVGQSAGYSCTFIDPAVTADYNNTIAMNFLGFVTAQPFNQDRDVVWCAAGTYSGTFVPGGVIIRGGYNSDFTERNVPAHQTVFTSASAFTGGLAICDGLYVTAPNTHVLEVAIAYNCHVDITTSAVANLTIFPNCFAYFCIVDVVYTGGNGAAGTGYYVVYGFATQIYGNAGGGLSSTIRCGVDRGLVGCAVNIASTLGNGGDGASLTYHGELPTPQQYFTGDGGTIDAEVILGNLSACEVDVSVTCGHGGDCGGMGVGASWVQFGQVSGGGMATAAIRIGTIQDGSTVVAEVVAGRGGDSNSTGYMNASGTSWTGGDTQGRITTDAASNSSITANATCGRGGNSNNPVNSRNAGGAAAAINIPFDQRAEAACVVLAGDGGVTGNPGYLAADGGSSASATVGGTCYFPKLSGSATCGDGHTAGQAAILIWGALPTLFASGDVTFTESDPTGDGNPVRVDALDGSTAPWWGGTPDGNGAPLAGYETPQGSGIALGRYWE